MLLHGMNHGAGDQSYRPFLLSTCPQSSPVWRPWWRATPGWSAAFSAHSAWAVSTPPMKSKIVVLRAGSPGLCGPSAMPSPRQNCKAWARTQGLSPLWAQPCLGPWAAAVTVPLLHPTHWSPASNRSLCPSISLPSLHCPWEGSSEVGDGDPRASPRIWDQLRYQDEQAGRAKGLATLGDFGWWPLSGSHCPPSAEAFPAVRGCGHSLCWRQLGLCWRGTPESSHREADA